MPSMTDDTTGPGTATILLSAASVVLVTIGASSTAWWLADQPTSDWPAWIEAGATVAAVGAAIVAGFYAARAFGLERQRESRWEDGQRSAQASLVAAWPDGDPWVHEAGREFRIYGGAALMRNASPLPVSNLRIEFWLVNMHDELPPTHLATTHLSYLPPREEPVRIEVTLGRPPKNGIVVGEETSFSLQLALEVTFRDAAGVTWRRDLTGRLTTVE